MKSTIVNVYDECLDEFFTSMGVPKDLSKILMDISLNEKKMSKKDRFLLLDEEYYQDEYDVYIYETCRYPPNSNPHKTLN